jgi:hypothetical protein
MENHVAEQTEEQKSLNSSLPREPIPAERLTFSSNMKDASLIGSKIDKNPTSETPNVFQQLPGMAHCNSEQILKKISIVSAPFKAKLMVKKNVTKLKPLIKLQKGKQAAAPAMAGSKNFPADFFSQSHASSNELSRVASKPVP